MSAHALWMRQCKKYRTKVSSSTGIGFSTIMLIPTVGVSSLSLVANSRTLDIAPRKRKVIDAEARRRNLPDYEKTKRDLLIPLGVSLTVFATVGLLDVLFFAGTSSTVLNGVADNGISALPAMAQDPSHFFLGVVHGVEFQVQQIFHFGSQILALGPDSGQAVAGASGLRNAVNGVTPNPINGSSVAATTSAFKVQAAEAIHSSLATPVGSSVPATLVVADKSIETAALSHATSGIPVELSGANVGVSIMETAETYAARYAIGDTGLADVATNTPEKKKESITATHENTMRIPDSTGEDARLAQKSVLTGEPPRSFLFLSKEYRPVSQWVMASKESCIHDNEIAVTSRKRIFCLHAINAEIQAYYHCCSCSDDKEHTHPSYDICEVCVAGRGCSCPHREDHVLHRKGLLEETVDYGDLSD